MSINDAYLQALRASGIQVHQGALGEIVVQTTPLRTQACARYVHFCSQLDTGNFDAKGVALLNLVRNELVFSPSALFSMTKGNYKLYKLGGLERCIDWQFNNGWRDRRFLSAGTITALSNAGFPCISPSGLRYAKTICTDLTGSCEGNDPLLQFMADAVAWWSDHIPGPLLAHALGFGKFQLLHIESWARLYAKEPQIRIESSAASESEKHLDLIERIERRTSNLQSTQSFMASLSGIAKRAQSRSSAREQIQTEISELIPVAELEGVGQVVLLAAVSHLIAYGGLRGTLLAPGTIYDYLRQGFRPLISTINELFGQDISGFEWLSRYRAMVRDVEPSQQGKFSAFLDAFHKFLVLAHEAPLPKSVASNGKVIPPCAAIVWEHELPFAIEWINSSGAHTRVKLQAKVALLLTEDIALRTIEPWCIRIADVHLGTFKFLEIAPRLSDGAGKTTALRRTQDLTSTDLLQALHELVQLRIQEDALEEDYLFGAPGEPNARFRQTETIRLINTALKWATGDANASYYDLRHTYFSTRTARLFKGDLSITDSLLLHQVSAEGGHAGPGSTASYIHILEPGFKTCSSNANHGPWAMQEPIALAPEFLDAVDSLTCQRQPLAPNLESLDLTESKQIEIDFPKRLRILNSLAKDTRLRVIANVNEVSLETVQEIGAQFCRILSRRGLIAPTEDPRKQRLAVQHFYLWSRTAKQPKHARMSKYINLMCASSDSGPLRLLFSNWEELHAGRYLSLHDASASLRFVNRLSDAGYSRGELVLVSSSRATLKSDNLSTLNIAIQECSARAGRPTHRLFLCSRAGEGATTRAASLSVLGLHWLLVCVGSHLISAGEI